MNGRIQNKAEAIVLRSLDYGESDRIVTFYTERFGKLRGIAKGARRSKRRFANALEAFSHSQIIFSRKGKEALALIENSDVRVHYAQLRNDLQSTLCAFYFVDLVDHFTVEGKASPPLFHLLKSFLDLLENGHSGENVVRCFELRLLKLAGYEPALANCIVCRRTVEGGGRFWFHVQDGGIRCERCSRQKGSDIAVSPGTIKLLLLGREMEISKIPRLVLSGRSEGESRDICLRFIRHLLGKDLKSLNVLQDIRRIAV